MISILVVIMKFLLLSSFIALGAQGWVTSIPMSPRPTTSLSSTVQLSRFDRLKKNYKGPPSVTGK